MRGDLIDRPSLSRAAKRALLVRHTIYSCLVVTFVTMGARIVSGGHQPRQADGAARAKGLSETLTVCRAELGRFEGLRHWLTQATASRGRPHRILMNLGKSLPDDVWITMVTVEDNDVRVIGSSSREDSLSTFLERLASQGVIDRVRLDVSRETRSDKQGAREFSISGTLADPAPHKEVAGEY